MIVHPLAHQYLFIGFAAAMQEHPFSRIDPQFPGLSNRGHNHRRTLIDSIHGVHPFRVGKTDETVFRRHRGKLERGASGAVVGKRISGGDFGEASKQFPHAQHVIFDGMPPGATDGIFEQRVGLNWNTKPVCELMGCGQFLTEATIFLRAFILLLPI